MPNEKKREAGIKAGLTHTKKRLATMERVGEHLISLHKLGWSSRAIAQQLNILGVQGPRAGSNWNQMSVLRYIGYLTNEKSN